MRLIADENISWRLKKLLPGWDILPANEIKPLQRISDFTIWQFAKANDYTILTFDEDFYDLQNIYSYPQKIIWSRTGNASTIEIANLLVKHEDGISDFTANSGLGIFEIHF